MSTLSAAFEGARLAVQSSAAFAALVTCSLLCLVVGGWYGRLRFLVLSLLGFLAVLAGLLRGWW